MQEIRNITIILLFLFLINSCSIFRRAGDSTKGYGTAADINELLRQTEKNNVGKKDFIISRFRVDYREGNNNKKAGGFIKRTGDGLMLVSIRSVAGIEIARASIDIDSINVYDRVNNLMYIQTIDYMFNKFGLQDDIISLLWGDLPSGLSRKPGGSSSDGNTYNVKYANADYRITINTTNRKLQKIEFSNTNYSKTVIEYSDYNTFNGITVPCEILLENLNRELVIKLKYYNLKFGKIKNMSFETGKIDDYIILK